MLRILGHGTKLCDGLTRRELMRVGGLSLFGSMTLPRLLRAAEMPGKPPRGRARSVIMFNLLGGPSHQDMFDLKPSAPAEIRGEFKPIATSVPGVQICEHLPRTARLMHKACLIRTFTHGFNSHDPLPFMTGYTDQGFLDQARPSDPPDVGAVCQYLGMGTPDLPGAVCMPCYPGWGEKWKRRGPYGGFLGSQYDPLFTRCEPTFAREPKVNYYDPVLPVGEPLLPSVDMLPDLTATRLDDRRSLLGQVDAAFAKVARSPAVQRLDRVQQKAFAMLTSSKTRAAFDLSKEPDRIRERYGHSLTGSSLLLARRLVESGVPFVSVHQEIFGKYGHSYDMHENNFGMLKDFNLPLLDRCVPALIEDLETRGLLDSTLVVVMGEMGRSPRVNGKAGRDHWPQCGFSLLFGGGVKAGSVYGATDKQAAYPVSHPVSPGDFIATIYRLLGIDPHLTVPDRSGRPIPIAHGGQPLAGVIA
jgi:hypothetical protein